MNTKTIVTGALLLFVAVSVVYLIAKETGNKTEQTTPTKQITPVVSTKTPASSPVVSEPVEAQSDKVIVYYFHGNMRCKTCLKIETYAKEAIETGFAEALKTGQMQWIAINIEKSENEHFVKDFELTTRSVVLEHVAGNKRKEWKNLQKVWEVVRKDKAEFLKYIQGETKPFYEAAIK